MANSWTTTTNITRSIAGTSLVKGDASNSQIYTDTSISNISTYGDPYNYNPYSVSHGESQGLFVYHPHGDAGKPIILLSFDLASVPITVVPYSSKIRLTIGACNLLSSIGLEIYRVLKPFTLSASAAQYTSGYGWATYMLGSGADYDTVLLDSVPVMETYVSGDIVELDVTDAIKEIVSSTDRVARFMIKPNDSRYASAVANLEYIRFYSGNTATGSYIVGYDTGVVTYPYIGNGTTDIPTLSIDDVGAVSFYLADSFGAYSESNTQVAQGNEYYDAGFVVPGTSSTAWKMYVKNNLEGYLYDIRIWCDWARASTADFTGTGTCSMGYISTINGNPAEGSPTTQDWKMTCISGGDNSVWSVQGDLNSKVLYGSYTWYNMSPSTFQCVGASGYYSSTANTQGISFFLTDADPDIGDYWTWTTYQNTVVPGANIDSENYLWIAADVDGEYGVWERIQPAHSLITLPISAGSTDVPLTSVANFNNWDDVVLTNMSNGQKYINTISSVNISGSSLVLTGGTLIAFIPGDQVQTVPFSIGDMASLEVKPFWLSLNVLDEGVGTGMRALRIQVTEGM